MASLRIAHLRWAQHYLNVLRRLVAVYQEGGENVHASLEQFERDWQQIRAEQSWTAANAENDSEAAKLCTGFCTCGSSGTGSPLRELRQPTLERIRWLEDGLVAARLLGDQRVEAVALYDLALTVPEWYGIPRSIEYGQLAQKLFHDLGDAHNESAALNLLGLAYSRTGDLGQAIEFHSRSLVIARDTKHKLDEVITLNYLAGAHRQRRDFHRAIEYGKQALPIAQECGEMKVVAQIQKNLGELYLKLGDKSAARDYLDQALATLDEKAIEESDGYGSTLGSVGLAFVELGDSRGLDLLRRNVSIMEGIGNRSGAGSALLNLGAAFVLMKDSRGALDAFQQAFNRFKDSGPRVLAGLALLQVGHLSADLGAVEDATVAYESALAILHDVGDVRLEGQSLWQVSLRLEKLGLVARAIASAQSALKVLQPEADAELIGSVQKQLDQWESKAPPSQT